MFLGKHKSVIKADTYYYSILLEMYRSGFSIKKTELCIKSLQMFLGNTANRFCTVLDRFCKVFWLSYPIHEPLCLLL